VIPALPDSLLPGWTRLAFPAAVLAINLLILFAAKRKRA
jgi:hypothetical protein